eukprot:2423828-Pleurochrysis_carterae.AAC.2
MDKRQSRRRNARVLCGIMFSFIQIYGVEDRLANAVATVDVGDFHVFLTEAKSGRIIARQRHPVHIHDDMLHLLESLHQNPGTLVQSGMHETSDGRSIIYHSMADDARLARITVMTY